MYVWSCVYSCAYSIVCVCVSVCVYVTDGLSICEEILKWDVMTSHRKLIAIKWTPQISLDREERAGQQQYYFLCLRSISICIWTAWTNIKLLICSSVDRFSKFLRCPTERDCERVAHVTSISESWITGDQIGRESFSLFLVLLLRLICRLLLFQSILILYFLLVCLCSFLWLHSF